MIKKQYEFKFEDEEHKQEFEEYLNGQEYVSYKKVRPTKKKIRKRLLDNGYRTFKFPKGFVWDGDEQIIEWIMDKLKVCDGNNWTVEEDTFFVIHSSRREDE